jgi:hypothetical protein
MENCAALEIFCSYISRPTRPVTIVKNLVIDHLISKAAEFHIPSGCTKKIHKNTNDSDQLRGLWLDFYVCGEIPGAQFQAELQDGRVHSQFLKDLAVAQMARIAKTNGMDREMPPYETKETSYHKGFGALCFYREGFKRVSYPYRGDYVRATRCLEGRFERQQARIMELKRTAAHLRKAVQM